MFAHGRAPERHIMKMKANRGIWGFGLVEAILLTVIVAVLVAILLPAFAHRRPRPARINCVNNEKQLGIAFRGFGIDMGGFPMQVTNQPAIPTEATNQHAKSL